VAYNAKFLPFLSSSFVSFDGCALLKAIRLSASVYLQATSLPHSGFVLWSSKLLHTFSVGALYLSHKVSFARN
jgi:hypothetical protein